MRKNIFLAISASIILGLLLGYGVFVYVLPASSITQKQNGDGLLISGTATIKVLGPSGNMVSKWTGPDPITALGMNALAACIPGSDGGSTTPRGPDSIVNNGSCSSFINAVAIVFAPANYPSIGGTCADNAGAETENGFTVTGCQAITSATNTLTPIGCDPNSSTGSSIPPLCTGWITDATFGPATFTATNCIYDISQTPCSVVEVDPGSMTTLTGYGHTEGFDYLQPTPIAVSSGDSLLVTITYTVS